MNNEQTFLSTLDVPKTWNINSLQLTPQQRANVAESIENNANNSADYTYAHRNNAIMSVALQDTVDNSNTGFWVTLGALLATDGLLNSANFLKSTFKVPLLNPIRLPIYALVGGSTFWAWTSGKFGDYSATAAVVNRDISAELNAMMDLKQ
jgi:hypothetical protein